MEKYLHHTCFLAWFIGDNAGHLKCRKLQTGENCDKVHGTRCPRPDRKQQVTRYGQESTWVQSQGPSQLLSKNLSA